MNRRRGATAVEMAVVAPVFFLLVFGLVEFGRMVMVKQALAEAARAGCRKAVLATTIERADAESVVRENMQPFMAEAADADACRVTISPAEFSEVDRGTEITTTVEVDCSDVSWISLRYMEHEVLRGQATMKRE
jgi:Flp pilus assembly protein TadG